MNYNTQFMIFVERSYIIFWVALHHSWYQILLRCSLICP